MAKKKIIKWEPDNFELETKTIWSFPDRGDWATHDGNYRGNWSPYVPRNLILRYSKPGDLVLDQFAGGGTTLVEAKLLKRNIIGIDVNPAALQRCREKCDFDYDSSSKVYVKQGDARKLEFIPDKSIDFICTHPPYADIIKYSNDVTNDISHFSEKEFLEAMEKVAKESFRVLKDKKYCAVLMGDIRRKQHVIPLSFQVMQVFQRAGFTVKEIIIKEQHNCKSTDRWKERSEKYNFLMLAHEYLFVFERGNL
mgnify:CR=1 FL=1